MAAADESDKSAASLSFEQALATLEDIVHSLEEGQIGLADALGRYEHGVKLLKECYQLLEQAERRIELLTRVGPSGDAVTQPFEDVGPSLEEKAGKRSQRRSRGVAQSPCEQEDARANDAPPSVDVRGGLF